MSVHHGAFGAGFRKQPMQEFGIGLITIIVAPILAVILMITIIRIPVGLFLLTTLGLLAFMTHMYAGLSIEEAVLGSMKTNFNRPVTYLIGLTVLLILSLIPFLGNLTKAVIELMAIGAIMTQKHSLYTQMQSRKMI